MCANPSVSHTRARTMHTRRVNSLSWSTQKSGPACSPANPHRSDSCQGGHTLAPQISNKKRVNEGGLDALSCACKVPMRSGTLRAKLRPYWPLRAPLRAAVGGKQAEVRTQGAGRGWARSGAGLRTGTGCCRSEPKRPHRLRGLPAERSEASNFLRVTCRAQRGKSCEPVVKKWGQVSLVVEDFPRGE